MRIKPLSDEEWTRLRGSLDTALGRMYSPDPETHRQRQLVYGVILDTLWETGCHVSVPCEPAKWKVDFHQGDDGWEMVWKRPKTRETCLMPISGELVTRWRSYLAQEWRPTRRMINEIITRCGEYAKIPDVSPLTIRHSVGFNLFKSNGPSAAKESLGVSDRSLQHYTRLHSGDRIKSIRANRPIYDNPEADKKPEGD